MKRLLFSIVYLILYKYDMCCKHYDKIVIRKEIFRERPPLEIVIRKEIFREKLL